MPELGYSMTIWTGEQGSRVQSRVQCALYAKTEGLRSVCSLNLDYSIARNAGEAGLLACLKCMIGSWDPDHGSAWVFADPSDGDRESEDIPIMVLFEYVRHGVRPSHPGEKALELEQGAALYQNAEAVRAIMSRR